MERTELGRLERSAGDTAVDGLMAGIWGGFVMVLFLLVVGLLNDISPAVVLGRYDITAANRPAMGVITHLAVSLAYGVIFSQIALLLVRLRPSLRRLGWLIGLVYGLALYGLATVAFAAGIDSGLAQYSTIVLAASHAVFGLVLGLILGRQMAVN